MDTVSPKQRSYIMSRIRSNDTKPEMVVRSFLHKNGFRFRLHAKDLPGHPDIVLPKYKTVVEVRGCFWHQHPKCKVASKPASNTEYWQAKLSRNVKRDKQNARELEKLGWRLIVVWECETSKKRFPPTALDAFVKNNRKNEKKTGQTDSLFLPVSSLKRTQIIMHANKKRTKSVSLQLLFFLQKTKNNDKKTNHEDT